MKPKSAFVEEEKKVGEEGNFLETVTRHEKRTSYDGEEIIKSMEPIFEYMNKNIMKVFEFLAIQSWEKYIDFIKKTKEKNALDCLKEKKEETHEPPSSEIGGVKELNEDYINSLPGDSEKYEETSHEYEVLKILKIILRHMLPWKRNKEHLLMDA